jgi:DNA-binding transcriptional ArsR family regulator
MEKNGVLMGLSALAQESRLDIFRLLVEAGGAGRPVGHIGETLGLPSATLSFHLGQLKHAGLVTVRRDGRSLIYAANFAAMNGLIAYLMENCCGGDADGCSPALEVACSPTGGTAIKEGASP